MVPYRKWFHFEKWYFDAQLEDGTFLFVYFADITLSGRRSGQVVASLTLPGQRTITRDFQYRRNQITVADDRLTATFGAGELSTGAEGCRFRWQEGDESIALEWSPLDPPWTPADEGVLFRWRKRRLLWKVPVPRAVVTGTVRLGALEREFRGLGYHDFVQTDVPPWRVPLKELLWGRALSDRGAFIWNRPLFAYKGEEDAVELAWLSEGQSAPVEFNSIAHTSELVSHPETGESYPATMSFELSTQEQVKQTFDLHETTLVLGDSVADVAGFGGRMERWLYRTFTGNPVEYKLLSRVAAEGVLQGALAAHERVLWGKRSKE